MVSIETFKNSKSFSVSSYQELIMLCNSLRIDNSTTPYTIYIKGNMKENGNYRFPFSYFQIINEDVVLNSSLYAKMKDENDEELTTWKTAALKITGSHNIFRNLKIKNIAGSPEIKGQEVALGIYGDDNIFIDCYFSSTQDTLFVGPLPDDLCTRYINFLPQDERYFDGNATNYFSHCKICGTVDFIFGAGRALFDECELMTLFDKRGETYAVAPSHSLKDDFGYLFYQCKFTKGDYVNDSSTYLARPWRDYGKCVFAFCKYDTHINDLGFHDWSDVNRTKTARFEEYPLKEGRVSWIHSKENSSLPKKYSDMILSLRKSIEE